MNEMKRVKCEIVGQFRKDGLTQYVAIGEAFFCSEASGLTDKAKFILSMKRPAVNFQRTFVVPMGGATIGKEFRTKFRVCDWSEAADGRCTRYGLGHLEPVTGILRTDSYYYELVADMGHLFWKAGRFVAHLNPQESPDFFTISAAA